MGIGETGVITLDHTQRGLRSFRRFVVDHDGVVVLDGEEQFLLLFIDGDAEGAVRRVQLAIWRHIADGLARKHHERVDGIVIDGVDITVGGIDVQAALKLDLSVQAADDALGFGGFIGRLFYAAVVYLDIE